MQNCIAAPAAPGLGLSLREVRASVKKLLKNRLYITFLILLGIASFGFTITHFAMGIDDFGLGHYMDLSPESSNNMLQQGAPAAYSPLLSDRPYGRHSLFKQFHKRGAYSFFRAAALRAGRRRVQRAI